MSESIRKSTALRLFGLLVFLYTFLVGITVLSGAVKSLGSGVISGETMATVSNPFVGLVPYLATTLFSSSVTTSLVVGLVGGGMPVYLWRFR